MPDETPDATLEDLIPSEVADGVARLTINNPDKANALRSDMRDHLAERFLELSGDTRVRVVVLRGAGDRHFCTGAALGGPQRQTPPKPDGAPERVIGDAARLIRHGWQRLVSAVMDCEKPVIAAVNGTAAGGGANLALACDLVVMADTARIIEVFVRRGIMADAGGIYLLPRLVGLHRAKELLFLGEECDATTAERIGIANVVTAAGELDATVDALAAKFCNLPTQAITLMKRMLNRSFESSREQSFDDEAYFQEMIVSSADCREGMTAFAERREPVFRGF